jgi:phage tail sheath gpL-like
MLREMFRVAQANAPAIPIWIVGVADAGVAPVWQATVGTLSGVGVGTLEICGETIQITVGITDTPTTIAAAIAAAVNAYYNPLTKAMLPISASASSAVVTFTALHKGAIMEAIDFYVPPGASNVFAQAGVWSLARTTAGSGNPSVAAALAVLGDNPADYVICPWSDSTSIASYAAWSNDVSGRWAWNRQSYGHVWTAQANNFAGLTTLGLSLNDRHLSIIGKMAGVAASDSVTFATNPSSGNTITIAGTVVTFETSGATGLQVNISSGSLPGTLTALLTFLQGASALADPNLSKFTYALASSTLTATAIVPGAAGNSFTLATNVSGATVASPTFTGGINGSPHPSWLWVTGFSARLQPWLSDCVTGNVSRNQTGLVVQGVLPPRDPSLWPNYSGRNTLVNSGISTFQVGADGSLQIDKVVTTYRTGIGGQPDTIFRDIQKMYQTAGTLKYFRAQLAAEQGNKSIVDENPQGLEALTTTLDIKASFVHAYVSLPGVLDDAKSFGSQLVVARNNSNRDRVDVFCPLVMNNPLDILASNATIYAQFPTALAA